MAAVVVSVCPSRTVRWNARGQPIGKESEGFGIYVGVIICQMVLISIENRRAPKMKPYKENVLDEIQKVYMAMSMRIM